jgi:hypothetical protein
VHAPENLSQKARETLDRIEYHPTTHDLGWHDLVAMLKEVAEVEESDHGRRLTVHLGDHKLVLARPEGTPVPEKELLEVRRLFEQAGFLGS